jgi:radical SAM superfamily enzyme YgiQ (UPF0313 family)
MEAGRKILFSSVFKPFGEADTLYSRRDSKIELFHNQITKYQGVFSPRVIYQTFGLHCIANNLGAPSVVLDYPTLDRFIAEIKKGYDCVGIGSIGPNLQKVKRMMEEIRRHSPKTKIVLGGFCAMIENIERMLEVDYVCFGEGISFMRKLLGFSPEFEFQQPAVAARTSEILGLPVFWGEYRPAVITGLGCPYGCDFCSPSHFFGKKNIQFLKTGQAIFAELKRLSEKYRSSHIGLLGDDNFLTDEKRARELHEEVKKSGLQFKLSLFASADLVSQWKPEELAEMGAYNIWIGRESKFVAYGKNRGVDLRQLLADLRKVGINVILSSILLLDRQTRENIWEDVEDHLAMNPAFSQFAFYSPIPNTPLYERLKEEGRLLLNIPFEEWHAFKQPVFVHPEFSLKEAEQIQARAYQEDFYRLGPGLVRMIATDLEGYLNLRDSKNPRLKARAEMFARSFFRYRAVLKAAAWLAPAREMKEQTLEILARLESASRKSGPLETAGALGIYGFGRLRELRTGLWGDAIQPRTVLTRYSGSGNCL